MRPDIYIDIENCENIYTICKTSFRVFNHMHIYERFETHFRAARALGQRLVARVGVVLFDIDQLILRYYSIRGALFNIFQGSYTCKTLGVTFGYGGGGGCTELEERTLGYSDLFFNLMLVKWIFKQNDNVRYVLSLI